MYKYIIMGEPIPLKRHRHGAGRAWDSQKQQKLVYGIQIKQQHSYGHPFSGPISLDIIFYMPMSKSSAKQHDKIRGTAHIFTPDLSNLIKWVEDCSVDAEIMKDDCIIYSINAKKLYDDAEKTRTEFTIVELK